MEKKNISINRVNEIAELSGLSLKNIMMIPEMPERVLQRKERLDTQASERLLLLENLVTHGLQVFDNKPEDFTDWLNTHFLNLKEKHLWKF